MADCGCATDLPASTGQAVLREMSALSTLDLWEIEITQQLSQLVHSPSL